MKTKVLSYRAIIEQDGSDYHGFVPSLPGVHTSGDSVESARANLRRAINQHLKVMKETGSNPRSDNSVEFIESFSFNYA